MGKTKNKMIKNEIKEHGSPKRFKAIKAAKTPEQLAEVIVKQHKQSDKPAVRLHGSVASEASKKKCRKCGKVSRHCDCGKGK